VRRQESSSRSAEVTRDAETPGSRSEAERGGGKLGKKSKSRSVDQQQQQQQQQHQQLEQELERIRQDYVK